MKSPKWHDPWLGQTRQLRVVSDIAPEDWHSYADEKFLRKLGQLALPVAAIARTQLHPEESGANRTGRNGQVAQ